MRSDPSVFVGTDTRQYISPQFERDAVVERVYRAVHVLARALAVVLIFTPVALIALADSSSQGIIE